MANELQGITLTTSETPIIRDDRFRNPEDKKLKALAKTEEAKAETQRQLVREVNNSTWLDMQQSPTHESTIDFQTGEVSDTKVIEEDVGDISFGAKSEATASMFHNSFIGDVAGWAKHDTSLFVEKDEEFIQN